MPIFDAAVMLSFFLLIGRWLDHRSRALARSAEELAAFGSAPRHRAGWREEVILPIAEVAVGDLILVRPGGRMPVDGVVEAGASEIDRGLLTGESLPVFAGPGSVVSAGEVNLTGPLRVRVMAAGREAQLHRMADPCRRGRGRAQPLYDLGRPAGLGLLFADGPCAVLLGLWLLDVEDRGRSALCRQYLGGGADHHLSLRLGPCRAGRGDGGFRGGSSARAC